MTRPSDTPTDPRLFPLERNATADMDARALDEIADILNALRRAAEKANAPAGSLALDCVAAMPKILRAVALTGRKV